MAKNTRDKLSRYFKDLDDIELCDSDGSNEEQAQVRRDDNAYGDQDTKVSTDSDRSRSRSTCYNKTGKSENVNVIKPTNVTATDAAQTKTPEDVLKSKTIVSNSTKLPSAHECLRSQNAPSFLNIDARKEVDWNTVYKSIDIEAEDTPVQNYEKNAVPPPASYEPVTDPGIKVVDSEGRKRKNISDDLQDQMNSTKAYKVEEENG